MIRTIKYAAGIGLLGAQLAGCGGAVVTEQGGEVTPGAIVAGPMCDYIEDRRYYTAELGDGGDTLDGGWLGHWSAHFADGSVRFNHSDVGSSGSYTCEDGEVIISLDGTASVALEFEHGENPYNSHLHPYQSFRFNPYGSDTKHYISADAELASTSTQCDIVAGRSYKAMPATAPDVMAVETQFVSFSSAQAVEYEIRGSGQAPITGIYDCDLGQIHLHSDANDTDPVVVTVQDDTGERIVASQGDYSIEMVETGSTCSAEARDVCVREPQNVQCFTTPCPDGFHKTISQCGDELAWPYQLVHEGSCGELEGQPFYEEVECSGGAAVCGAVLLKEPCDEVPCPSVVHQTLDNACEAQRANAPLVAESDCADLTGEPVTELSIACTEEAGFPVCAKTEASIQCVTTPCPSHQYQSFLSQCAADSALASIAFEGSCGDMEGAVAFAHPPVQLVENLPQVEKPVTVDQVAFDGDQLTVELGYSGCDPQHFHLFVSTAFKESAPVQVDFALVPMVEDGCQAYFSSRLTYDLAPLKHAYQQRYQTQGGSIQVPKIGVYSF